MVLLSLLSASDRRLRAGKARSIADGLGIDVCRGWRFKRCAAWRPSSPVDGSCSSRWQTALSKSTSYKVREPLPVFPERRVNSQARSPSISRSIHTTRRDLTREARWRFSSRDVREERLGALTEALQKKRRIKRWSRLEREATPQLDLHPVAADDISIEVVDQAHAIHYPASPADIRAILQRLPPGVLNGLSGIRLCLGREAMEEDLSPEERREEERDPWLGRVGVEALPGVYAAPILGTFSFPTCRIDLNAYVYDPEIPDRRRWECYLRLRMLATLVHELAHFQDYKLRTARGRWRADDEDKAEVYAERTTARWVREIAVPWLEEAYPADVHDLEAWVAHHGGATIPLELLAGSWHWDSEGRVVEDLVFGGANSAFKSLVCNVHKGVEPSEACLDFAEELHWGGLHPEAHRVLERILLDEPSNLAALTLRADVFVHEEEHDRAEALARQVIGLDESYVDAWHVLADVHEARADWERLYESAGQAIARKSEERDRWSFREQRARAELELGREAELAEDLEALKHSVPIAATAADAFRALQLVRKGRFEEALEIAQLSRTYVVARHRAVFDAVRFEASHRLGRAGLAGRLTPRTIRTLGYLHLGSWADRLVSEFGRGKSY